MRYYVITIQYNKEVQAENRSIPKAYDDLDSAIAEYHRQVGVDMNNSTLGWALSIVIDDNGQVYRKEKWTRKETTSEELS